MSTQIATEPCKLYCEINFLTELLTNHPLKRLIYSSKTLLIISLIVDGFYLLLNSLQLTNYRDTVSISYLGFFYTFLETIRPIYSLQSCFLMWYLDFPSLIDDIQKVANNLSPSIHTDLRINSYMMKVRRETRHQLIALIILYTTVQAPILVVKIMLKFDFLNIIYDLLLIFVAIKLSLIQGIYYFILARNCAMIRAIFMFVCSELRKSIHEHNLDADFIKIQRHNHHLAIQLVYKSNKIWKIWIPIFCAVYSITCTIYFYSILFLRRAIYVNIYSVIHVMISFYTIFVIITELTTVNRLASKPHHDLYRATFGNRSKRFKTEAQLFLHRINRRDIGFTFLDLFIISPEILWKFFTVITTSIMAIPSLRKPTIDPSLNPINGTDGIVFMNQTTIEFENVTFDSMIT